MDIRRKFTYLSIQQELNEKPVNYVQKEIRKTKRKIMELEFYALSFVHESLSINARK